jgi:hypothetical protein
MTDVSPETGRALDDGALVQYLIGGMSDEDVEMVDELSVADAELEARLRAVEHDLVDAYVNRELTGETLERFKSNYLSSPAGLAKVEIAEALRGYRRDPVGAGRTAAPVAGRAVAWWPLAAAAVLALAAGLLAIDDVRLRRQATDVRERLATLEQRERQLQEAIGRQQSELTATSQELARVRDALAAGQVRSPEQPSTARPVLEFVLLPANRDAGETPTIAIPADAETVTLRFQLEGEDYARYEAVIKDASTDRILWRSGHLRPVPSGNRQMLPAAVRTNLLPPGAYTAVVAGIPERGPSEPLDHYPFRVVLQ